MAAGSGTSRVRAGATSDKARILAAIAKYGPSVQALAEKRYGISGEALLAKTLEGESRALSNPAGAATAVSSAGAKKWAQFMPGSRAEAVRKYGVDPWGSPEDAVHAMALHLRGKINGSTGLEGYNPGDPNYPKYILGQHVGDVHGTSRAAASTGGGSSASSTSAGSALGVAFDAGQQSRLSDALAAAAAPAPVMTGSLPQLPNFAAGPSLPQGYQAPPSGGGPQPVQQQVAAPALSDLSLPAASGGPTATTAMSDAPTTSGGGGRAKGAKRGDPVIGGTSIGGQHDTMGLAGYPARDYFAKAGSVAVAPVSGKVIRLSGHDPKNGPTNGPHGPLGWSLYLKGSDGRTYFLTHLGSRTVKVGQKLEAGEEIGTVADYDKYGTPSHIHMGVHGGR